MNNTAAFRSIFYSPNYFLLFIIHCLLKNKVPVVQIVGAAALNVAQVVVEARAFFTWLAIARNHIFCTCFDVVNLAYWCHYSGRSAGCGFVECGEFFDGYWALFDSPAKVATNLHQAVVCDRWQNAFRFWRDVGVAFDAEEIRSAALVDVALFFRIEIDGGVVAKRVCYGVGLQTSSVVAAHLVATRAERCCAVVLTQNAGVHCAETVIKIGADGRYIHDEFIFLRWAHAKQRTYTNYYWANVERRIFAVWWNETLVHADCHFDSFDEFFGWHLWHHQSVARTLQAQSVGFGTENADFAIDAARGFDAFVGLLSVVQARRGYRDVDFGRVVGAQFAPLAVFVVAAYIIIGLNIVETYLFPIDFHISKKSESL